MFAKGARCNVHPLVGPGLRKPGPQAHASQELLLCHMGDILCAAGHYFLL